MTSDKLRDLRTTFNEKVGWRNRTKKSLDLVEDKIIKLEREIIFSEKAQMIIQVVAKETQQQLESHISNLVTMALATVFEDPYTFKIKFIEKRNKTECELLLEKDGEEFDPLSATGGGIVDMVSFALRVALWNIAKPRSRNVLILDEPFRFISRDLHPKAATLLKKISKELNLQIIMVSHSLDLIAEADKVFEVSIKGGVTEVI